MPDNIQLEIVTPERLVVQDTVVEVQIPGKNGYLGILPGHAPLITELSVGEISYRVNGLSHYLAVAWGFAEVLPTRVTVLAESAERAEEIDVERARRAKEHAEQMLRSNEPDTDFPRVLEALKRAETRLDVAAKRGT
jgi:F-type H+-transporting ATPase subunit epsilon